MLDETAEVDSAESMIKLQVSQKGVQKIAKEVGDVQQGMKNAKPMPKLQKKIEADAKAVVESEEFRKLVENCKRVAEKAPRFKPDVEALRQQLEKVKKMEMDMWNGKKHCSKQENQQGKDFWLQVNNKQFAAYNKEIEKMAALEKKILDHPWV